MSIYLKLQQVRVELQKSPIKKSGKNKFSNFSYFELADFLPTVNELFLKYKLVDVFSLHTDRAEIIIFDAESTETITFTSSTATAEMKGITPIQQKGAENTYMRRYLLINALNIVENDLLDPLVGSDKMNKPPLNPWAKQEEKEKKIQNAGQIKILKDLTKDVEPDLLVQTLKTRYNVERIDDLSHEQSADMLSKIELKKNAKQENQGD
jgi:hypothetical protein